MKTHEIERISETLGGNLGVLILAGGEPFTRKDLPPQHWVQAAINNRIWRGVLRLVDTSSDVSETEP